VPGHQPWSTGQQPAVPADKPPRPARVRTPGSTIRLATTAVLVLAGALGVGSTFAMLERQVQTIGGGHDVTLDYSAWKVTPAAGSVVTPLTFHAPHFGIPLTAAGVLTLLGGLLLVLGKDRLATLARPVALASAGLLVGTVWAVGMTLSADFDAAHTEEDFKLEVSGGLGLWLLLAAGVLAAIGGLMALLLLRGDSDEPIIAFGGTGRVEPATPRYGFPALGQQGGAPQGQQASGQQSPGQQSPQGQYPVQSHQYPSQQQPTPQAGQSGPQPLGGQLGQPTGLDQPTQHVQPGQHLQPGQGQQGQSVPPGQHAALAQALQDHAAQEQAAQGQAAQGRPGQGQHAAHDQETPPAQQTPPEAQSPGSS
jgi:uncharacterized membrane protein YphA (DoxX/SURF4 family)